MVRNKRTSKYLKEKSEVEHSAITGINTVDSYRYKVMCAN